jgi:hypothetical protein
MPIAAVMVCAADCTTRACPAESECIADQGFEPSCFATCERVTDCVYGFDCFDLREDGKRYCLPTEWAILLERR